jgi:uncharacterized protein (TIGR02271 family)
MVQQQATYVNEGADVFGADGEKVGSVSAVETMYIVVEKGFFFPTDYYIPKEAIQSYNEDQVFLTITKDEALNQGWDQPPAQSDGVRTEDDYRGDMGTPRATQADARATETDSRQTARTHNTEEVAAIPVHEEHLDATRRQTQDAGEVQVSKRVVTEQETVEVPVTEERIRVDWKETPSGGTVEEGHQFEEGSFEIPVQREEVDVRKRTVQTGEVELSRERDQHTEQVTDTVRKEVVDVDEKNATNKKRR